MRRHRELTSFIVSLPFIAVMPYLLPRPAEFESSHTLLAVGYVVAVIGLSRLIVIGMELVPLRRLLRQDGADRWGPRRDRATAADVQTNRRSTP